MEHIRFATNRGNIITTMTVFAQQKAGQVGPRIWNTQLLRYPLLHIYPISPSFYLADNIIRYAGYQQPDGSVIGDPCMFLLSSVNLAHLTNSLANIEMTEAVQNLGWVGEGTRFDL